MRNLSARVILLCSSSCFVLTTNTALAQVDETESLSIENVVVTGTRQAYRGEFTKLETPQSEVIIDAEVLANAGVFDLNQALDLSSSVAR